ncbi:hypothetical protein [Streptomyces boncukensis]|uniref:hypothetical protein n=1 Tax=Streptomyces boncukensis TaxID=2711219 RepID=UPI003B96A785
MTARAVELAARLATGKPEQRDTRHGRRIERRLSRAVARAMVGVDAQQRRRLLDQLAARRHAAGLATVELASPWEERPDPTASELAAQTRDQMRRAVGTIRDSPGCPQVLFADVSAAHPVNTDGCSLEQPAPPKLGTEEARSVIEDGRLKGRTVRETAEQATRAPSYGHSVFAPLDRERGPRPARAAFVNGTDSGRSGDWPLFRATRIRTAEARPRPARRRQPPRPPSAP